MLRALAEHGVQPDVILGTSIGAVNGAFHASNPTLDGAEHLAALWSELAPAELSALRAVRGLTTLARSRTHLQSFSVVRAGLAEQLPVQRIEELSVPFQCVAASIERAAEHWFAEGPLAEALIASCAVPGILPAVRIGNEHYIDGGIVNSIPVSRAVRLGASRIFVLQVGRLEQALRPPRWPWEVGLVAFEVARRHRFADDLSSLPPEIQLHVLPTGGTAAPAYNDLSAQLRIRRVASGVQRQIESAYLASREYLESL